MESADAKRRSRKRNKKRRTIQTRSTPLYDNCLIEAPDGQKLCRTSRSKIDWYLVRNLGEIVEQDPLTLRLFFEPNGRNGADHPYTTAFKFNVCVVCGSQNEITRHHVVPRCFRRYFPEKLKNHALHDVLILCRDCHNCYEHHASEFKKEIAAHYNVSMNRRMTGSRIEVSARIAANALVKYYDKIPEVRRKELLSKVQEFCGKTDVSEEEMKAISQMELLDPSFRPYGAIVVERLENIDHFVKQWRQHFCVKMAPQFLPDHWHIDNTIY